MSTGLTSPILEPIISPKSSRTSSSSSHHLADENIGLITVTPYAKSSNKVTVCTLCGRYAGLRPVLKSSLLSFYV